MLEAKTIQQKLTSNKDPKNITAILKKFGKLVEKKKDQWGIEIANK